MDRIIYHAIKEDFPCADGIAAAWVAHKVYPQAELTPAIYGEDRAISYQAGDRFIIVDFSFPADLIQIWIDNGVEILLIDHHKSALENLGHFLERTLEEQVDNNRFVFDMEECGATLTWKYFFPDQPVPEFLKYVRDRDLWRHELPGTEEVHEAIGKIGRTFDLFDRLERMSREELLACLQPIGEVLLKPRREAVRKAADRVEYGTVAGYGNIPYVLLAEDGSEDHLVSDICAVLYTRNPESLFSAALNSEGKWSLRSNSKGKNTDVSVIAKQFGGGGHRNASGYVDPDGLRA